MHGKNRIIPINKKILPFIEKYYNPNNKYLITNENGEKMTYQNYRRENYNNIMEKLKMSHTPHECRHTRNKSTPCCSGQINYVLKE